jgi:hypothetical protein
LLSAILTTALVLPQGAPVMAQTAPAAPAVAAVSADGLEMPKLDFTATPEIESDYDKYFYFHRADTTFTEAYTDIRECDALASGSRIYLGGDNAFMSSAVAQYGLGGAIGGALGSVLADAIFGAAQRRKERRVKMRNCMGFKGYQRYGLAKDLWESFNFQEGNGRKKEEERDRKIRLQAMVASGPAPKQEALPK